MKQAVIISALLFMIVLSGVSHAEMYKWTDKDGVMHWSDGPSNFNGAENITVTNEVKSSGTDDETSRQDDQIQQLEDVRQTYTEEVDEYTQQDEQENEAPPDVIEMPDTDDVYVVPDTEEDLFFWDGWWWRQRDGHWSRSHYYHQGWAYYNNVPRFYSNVDPDWRRYYKDRTWHGRQWNCKRIPGRQLQQDWKSPNNNRYREGQGAQGIQTHQAQPQQQIHGSKYQVKGQYQQKPGAQQHPQSVHEKHDPKAHNNPGKDQQHPQGVHEKQRQSQQQHDQPRGQQHQKSQGQSQRWDQE